MWDNLANAVADGIADIVWAIADLAPWFEGTMFAAFFALMVLGMIAMHSGW